MRLKVFIGLIMAFILLFPSCYPELSVQQYDKLREDLEALDVERQELRSKVSSMEAELTIIEAKNKKIQDYIIFLHKLVSTQSSAKILEGEFDPEALITSKAELFTAAEGLEDGEINYFLGLMDPENESQTVSAYYKIIEYCVKKIKQNLE